MKKYLTFAGKYTRRILGPFALIVLLVAFVGYRGGYFSSPENRLRQELSVPASCLALQDSQGGALAFFFYDETGNYYLAYLQSKGSSVLPQYPYRWSIPVPQVESRAVCLVLQDHTMAVFSMNAQGISRIEVQGSDAAVVNITVDSTRPFVRILPKNTHSYALYTTQGESIPVEATYVQE